MKTIKLPSKPSKLITLALHDLKLTEADPRYVINMGSWHQPRYLNFGNGSNDRLIEKCEVCLAGAVLAQTIKLPIDVDYRVNHNSISYLTRGKIAAIDFFRQGEIGRGLIALRLPRRPLLKNRQIQDYWLNPVQFKLDMKKLARNLKRAGL